MMRFKDLCIVLMNQNIELISKFTVFAKCCMWQKNYLNDIKCVPLDLYGATVVLH